MLLAKKTLQGSKNKGLNLKISLQFDEAFHVVVTRVGSKKKGREIER